MLEEKEELEKQNNSLRTEIDLEKKQRQELAVQKSEFESKPVLMHLITS